MAFEHYIRTGGKDLRCGYTTGTCAALAAQAAAQRLLLGRWPDYGCLMTPKGIPVEVIPEEQSAGEGYACCAVRKDGGDDIDRTSGALIFARVEYSSKDGIQIDGGMGVGRVTKPGLDQAVGEAAINRVPREMIREAVIRICREAEWKGGLKVTIFVPDGEKIAEKTFNPNLGIIGGISILGTSGIVEPMSLEAIRETVCLELKQRREEGYRHVLLTPGNYGLDFLRSHEIASPKVCVVTCSNFIGDAIDCSVKLGFESILLVGHAGKLFKLAGGIMNTHSQLADCRTELVCAHAAVCGASTTVCRELLDAATSDACVAILQREHLQEPVMHSLVSAIASRLEHRAGEVPIGAILFSNEYGELGRTESVHKILPLWNNENG